MVRLVLFADARSSTSAALTAAALAAAPGAGAKVVAVVDTAHAPLPRAPRARRLAADVARRVFEPHRRWAPPPRLSTSTSAARRAAVPALVPPRRDVNDPAFVETVRGLRPDASLALLVGRVFSPALLDACAAPANYHNGLLPAYRGIAATAWSVYRGEARSGFSFHRMNERVDDGPVLLQDSVAVEPGAGAGAVEAAKTRLAVAAMPRVLDLLARDEPGRPQRGEPSTFTRADLAAVVGVGHPSALTWDDLSRRIRCFGRVHITLAGEHLEVTALRRVEDEPRHPALAFTTADGVRAEPYRFLHLPLGLYRLYRRRGPGP